MFNKNKVIALVPARGGSKGLPNKNIKLMNGKPLIAWTIECALKSKYIDKVLVSTDSPEIAEISKQFGAHVPFLRPDNLSTDSAKSHDVILHAIEWLKNNNDEHEIIIYLQPTSPLRSVNDIDNSIEMLSDKHADAVVSVCEMAHPPFWANVLPEDGCMKDFLSKEILNKNRQELPKYYILNGALYTSLIKSFIDQQGFYGNKTFAYIMPSERSVDIDSQLDFNFAEFLFKTPNLLTA